MCLCMRAHGARTSGQRASVNKLPVGRAGGIVIISTLVYFIQAPVKKEVKYSNYYKKTNVDYSETYVTPPVSEASKTSCPF